VGLLGGNMWLTVRAFPPKCLRGLVILYAFWLEACSVSYSLLAHKFKLEGKKTLSYPPGGTN
jgi:hypothetical protein